MWDEQWRFCSSVSMRMSEELASGKVSAATKGENIVSGRMVSWERVRCPLDIKGGGCDWWECRTVQFATKLEESLEVWRILVRIGSSSSDFKDAVELCKERRIAWDDEGKRMEFLFTLSSVA